MTGDAHSETGDPARLPAQVAGWWRHINWKSIRWGKKIVLADQSSQGRIKISFTGMKSPTNQPRKVPFCVLWVPIHLRFNSHSQQGRPLSGLSGQDPIKLLQKSRWACLHEFFKNCILFLSFLDLLGCFLSPPIFFWFISTIFHLFTNTICGKYFCFLSISICCIYNVHEHLTHFRIYLFAQKTKGKKKTI